MTHHSYDEEIFGHAYDELMKELPEPVVRVLARLRAPRMRWVRISTGVVCVVGGCFAFLPILGLELLPLGLLLLAHDVPVLRVPTATALLWLVTRWRALKQSVRGVAA